MFVMLVILLAFTLLSYSKEGDIKTITTSISNQTYNSKRKIVQRMRDLILYDNYSIKWPKILCIALFTSIIITYYFIGQIEPSTVMLLTGIIFIAIDIPNRWANIHKKAGLTHELGMLYAMFNLPKSKKTDNQSTVSYKCEQIKSQKQLKVE